MWTAAETDVAAARERRTADFMGGRRGGVMMVNERLPLARPSLRAACRWPGEPSVPPTAPAAAASRFGGCTASQR